MGFCQDLEVYEKPVYFHPELADFDSDKWDKLPEHLSCLATNVIAKDNLKWQLRLVCNAIRRSFWKHNQGEDPMGCSLHKYNLDMHWVGADIESIFYSPRDLMMMVGRNSNTDETCFVLTYVVFLELEQVIEQMEQGQHPIICS